MLRISELATGRGHLTLKLEGRIVGPWVTELETACKRLAESGQAFRLDLADVFFVDRTAVSLLLTLESSDVVLDSMTPFVQEELREARAAKTQEKLPGPGSRH